MGFSTFSSYGTQISGLGKARVALGSLTEIKRLTIAGGNGGNAIALSDDGFTWRLPNQVPSSFTRGNIAGYDGKRIIIGGNSDILYSDDLGVNWFSTGFNAMQIVLKITYIESKKIWFATGISNSNDTIAYSSNGVNWTLPSNKVFSMRCYGIEYNGNVFIAIGWGQFPTATSPDGINWTLNTTFQMGTIYPHSIYYDGSRYIVGDTFNNREGNISTSQDGITWVKNIAYLPMDIRCIDYNGEIYLAVGTDSSTANSYYWSNDLINWNIPNNNLLGKNAWSVVWDGNTFIIGSPTVNSVNTIYSTNGKDWSVSNTPFTGTVYGFKTIAY